MAESAAALLQDGALVAACEEERFTRVKHAGGFPYRSIRSVLEQHGATLADVDHVAVYWNPYRLGHRVRYMLETLLLDPGRAIGRLRAAANVMGGIKGEEAGWFDLLRVSGSFRRGFGSAPKRVHFLDHHACHMATCFWGSEFDDAAILVMDASGEAACTTWGSARGERIDQIGEHLLPHSLGHFYSAVTAYLGFKMFDGEYKLMGLSPYGNPKGASWIRENLLRSVGSGRYMLDTRVLDFGEVCRGVFRGPFVEHFGPPRPMSELGEFTDRHRDVAASAQRAFEEVAIDMARELRRVTGSRNLAIAGGCGLNCTANGKILGSGEFDALYVPPVPNDAGGAWGAAMLLHNKLTGKRPAPLRSAQLGPRFSDAETGRAVAEHPQLESRELGDGIAARAAEALADGAVIAWMQGGMEYGARALGGRSFLADPRSDSVREKINEKIKKRELFRPFAPSVKAERADDYFELGQSSPFMTIVVPVRADQRNKIPAVTHVDGTARPQTVERDVSPRYWALLDQFERRTGVPVLLNTSFNIQEPIVCTPSEALRTFCQSGVDAIAIGGHWVTRKQPH
jgi:carbamoyltransferase